MQANNGNSRTVGVDQLSAVDHYVLLHHASSFYPRRNYGLTLVWMVQLAETVPAASLS